MSKLKETPRMTCGKRKENDVPNDAKCNLLRKLKQHKNDPLCSDYERQTQKPRNQQKSRELHKAKKTERQKLAEQMGATEAQFKLIKAYQLQIPAAPLAYAYRLGENLLEDAKELHNLPIRMRQLHNWYKE
jgi:hypothetical protein